MGDLSSWRGRRVLVTGGSGFIGRHVVEHGLRAGVEVHTLSRASTETVAVVAAGEASAPDRHVQHWHHQADIRDAEWIAAVVREVQPDAIMHLAAAGVIASSTPLSDQLAINAAGLANLLSATRDAGLAPPVVVAGSGFEYGQHAMPISEDAPLAPTTDYGVSKAAASLVARHFAGSLPVTLLRLFSVYGVGEREPRLIPSIIAAARRGEAIKLTGGEQVRDFTDVRDVAETFWRVVALGPSPAGLRVLNVGTGQPARLRALVERLAQLLEERGCAPRLEFGALPYRAGEPMTYVAKVDRLRAALGWSPGISLEDGLRHVVEAT